MRVFQLRKNSAVLLNLLLRGFVLPKHHGPTGAAVAVFVRHCILAYFKSLIITLRYMKAKFIYHTNNHIFIFKCIVLTTDFPDFSKH